MNRYAVKSVQHFPDHILLTLTPESEDEQMQFWPGQYATLSFRHEGRLSTVRCFSIIGVPGSTELQFATRTDGPFTRQLARLEAGDSVRLQGPFGNFVLDPSDRNIVMLAAGIGITPFISMLRVAVNSQDTRPMTLLYGCRSAENIPFEAELRQLQAKKANLRVVFVVPKGVHDPARGLYVGRIDDTLLRRVTGERWQPFTFFVCGPGRFMKHMQTILRHNQVSDDQIISEAFTQSTKFDWRLNRFNIPALTYAATSLSLVLGVGFIMTLDLLRVLPKTKAVSLTTPSSTTTTQATTTQTPNNSSSNTATTSNTSSSSNTPANTTNYTQTYQAPVSTVS